MSASGQSRHVHGVGAMSAVTQRATNSLPAIRDAVGPFATKSFAANWPLFDHLVSPSEQCLRNLQIKHPRGFEIDHQLELSRLHHRKVGWACASSQHGTR
jgi:hypothetical protein